MVSFNGLARYGAASLVAAGQAAALVPINLAMHAVNLHAKPDPEQRVSVEQYKHKYPNIKAYNFSVPIDHFHNESRYEPHSSDSFPLRYWLDISNYKPGGPVIVLHSGEYESTERLPYLQHGIVPILTKATGGVGLIMEHRYYGTSFPVPDLTTENLRFLSTEQALADTAYFAKNIEFPGLEHLDLTASGTPWIIYGGSYAGAFAAFTRKLYPDVYWGGISSSGVTAAVEDLWQYFEAARQYAPGDCGPTTQKITHIVDSVLFGGDSDKVRKFKEIFGLGDLEDDEFATTITRGLYGLQSTNWDPEEDVASLGIYCAVITSNVQLFSSTTHLIPTVRSLVNQAGFAAQGEVLSARLLNYIGYVRDYVKNDLKSGCKGKSVLECFSSRYTPNDSSLNAGWLRSWSYQVCTQWGYFVTGSGTPKDQLPMISRAITLESASSHCERLFNITTPPDIESINKLGGFNFSYPRLAILDGVQDPWRSATPHASGLPDRKSTTSEPFVLIDWGVHHWDEFGLPEDIHVAGLPPPQVAEAHKTEIEFVKAWLKEWEVENGSSDREEEESMGEL
ncbi:serine carboxypeptidase s28 [Trichoderma arundinaceum]|uniref:Serine carboxypeptidase s28 n=1 Tax=Trichoderma arundinaceum TaxID=490622 RepID=A0A395NYZ0_TRIAR|nr:serine carboxypeptidase s28 [Trichoderma arundinaceum]